MVSSGGRRLLGQPRSHRKLQSAAAAEMEEQKLGHRRQNGESAPALVTRSSSVNTHTRTHWPPIEWDPLKLNPPTPPAADLPGRPRGDSLPESSLRSKQQSFAGRHERRPRMHHSDSGFSLLVFEGFDFGFEREDAMGRGAGGKQHQHQQHQHDDDDDEEDEEDMHEKSWPSPTSSVDSGKAFFDDNDDEDGAVKRSNELCAGAPAPRRRPQVASPDDPTYFIQRGGWKRRGIVFGGQKAEVSQKDEEVFNII